MPFRATLQKLIRRDATAPSLRERAAELRASISPRPVDPQAQPTPGSPEAKAAWHAACHAHSVRTALLQDCPDLMRTERDVWSTDDLFRAMEAGEITAAEYARLHPLASERELRFAEIAHDLRIGSLFALAYAEEYPAPLQSQDEAGSQIGSDPILVAIAASRRAEAEMAEFNQAVAGRPLTDTGFAREDALDKAQRATRRAVWATVPTTTAGRLALVEYAKFQAALTYGDEWRAEALKDMVFGDAFLALAAAIKADASPTLPD
jgi:hypothetical protein